MAKAFQSNAFQNDTLHSVKGFQVETGAVAPTPQWVLMSRMRAINPEYMGRSPGYRGMNVEYQGRNIEYSGKGVDYRAR